MRVFHVSDCYAPRTGGIETHLHDLGRAQMDLGNEVHILTVEVGRDGEVGGVVQDDDGISIHRLGARMPLGAPFNPRATRRAIELIEDLDPDVIHVHAGIVCPFAYGVAKAAMASGRPVAVTWHSMLDHSSAVLRPWARLTGWRGAPAALSAVSRISASHAARVFGRPVAVLHDGIDQSLWTPSDTPSPAPPPLRCVTAARLVPKKGMAFLLDAVAEAVDDLPKGALTLDIFGDGPDRWRIDQKTVQRQLDDVVRMRGRVPRSRLISGYRQAHVFCAPARREAFGIAALEARTAGLVIVGRRGNGLDEYVTPGVDSVLVNDPVEMSRTLVRLATDHAWFESLRTRARDGIPRFDYRQVADETMAEYQRAMQIRAGAIAGTF